MTSQRTTAEKTSRLDRLTLLFQPLVLLLLFSHTASAQSVSTSQSVGRKVQICHQNSDGSSKTLQLPVSAALKHLQHGDTRGPCRVEDACSADLRRIEATLESLQIPASSDVEATAALLFPSRGHRPPIGDLTSVPPRTKQMAQCIHDAFALESEVGYSFAIAKDGLLDESGAGGFARAPFEATDPSVPMQDDTRMTLASVSKPLTAVGVMRLIEIYGLDLDDALYPLIASEFEGTWIDVEGNIFEVPAKGIEAITLRQILSHRGGITPGLGCGRLSQILGLPPATEPGTAYDYENANFCLLRKVIENVSGESYTDWMQNHVLSPMGIVGMSCEPDAITPALYYNTIGSAGKAWGSYEATCAAYGWYASSVQLAQFLANVRYETVLSSSSTDEMLNSCFNKPGSADVCLGWFSVEGEVGTYRLHQGDWIAGGCWDEETETSLCPRGLNSTIVQFPHGIDAAVLVNTRAGVAPNPGLRNEYSIVRDCYEEAFRETNGIDDVAGRSTD